MIQVLIVEDEKEIAELLSKFIMSAGMNAHIINNGLEATQWIRDNSPDLVVLDLMLPGKSGEKVCKEVRRFSDVPIIMATAKVEEVHRLIGFEMGASDYICKPYSAKEVIARIKSLVALYNRAQDAVCSLHLDREKLRANFDGDYVEFSHVEFKLLSLLYNHPDRIYSREQVVTLVYEDSHIVSGRTVDSHIRNIRKKLYSLNTEREYIRSVYGAGYKIEC